MLNSKGFTLTETLFVMSIILMLSLVTVNIRPHHLNSNYVINDISLILHKAKTNAMTYKENVSIQFNDNCIYVNSTHFNKTYRVKNGRFSKHSFSYNKNGHIVNPKTVTLNLYNDTYQFIFQIGAGCFYVKE